jgi:hypothetical protein
VANFQLPGGERYVENTDHQGMIWLHTGNKVTLDFIAHGPPSGGDKRDVISGDPKTVVISNVQRTRSKLTFTVSAVGSPSVVIDGMDGSGKKAAAIAIFAGDFKNQSGMAIDLLADICRGPNAAKTLAVQRLLFSQPDNIFDQNNNPVNLAKFGKWGCGKIVKASGTALFDQVSEIQYENPYHEPLDAVKQRTDVKYKSATIAKVRTAIQTLLQKGIPVRVGVLDSPMSMQVQDHKLIAYFKGGHTTLIVGCDKNAKQFLYIDTWRDGSELKYDGGISSTPVKDPCMYMGLFTVMNDPARLVAGDDKLALNLIQKDPNIGGTFKGAIFLEIVSGPPIPR